MIKAVIFDMFETLVTHYKSPLYFGLQMAMDAGIPENAFQSLWKAAEHDRTVGKQTLEETLKSILITNQCYSKELLEKIVTKRKEAKNQCFSHLHPEIIPMLEAIKKQGYSIGLISNCFSEEVEAIKNSSLFQYFDTACLSFEQGIQKPDEEIFIRCMERLSLLAEECLYVGDGGSFELEAASKIGMKAVQAVWYLQGQPTLSSKRNPHFVQIETPLEILNYI